MEAEGKAKVTPLDQLQERLIEGLVQQACHPAIKDRGDRLEDDVVLRPANLGVRLQLMDQAIGEQVAARIEQSRRKASLNMLR